jgi:hypothetical protein
VCGACANNVAFDKATGPDGKIKGAKPVALAENAGKANGIVTYPGGDRIDWKLIELPEGQEGRLELQMTYSTPRPGLRVTFDVFDRWNVPVKDAAVSGKGRIKSATVAKAAGKYFVRIYAPRRGDAGQYKLTAEFHPELKKDIFDASKVAVADPPKIIEIPEPVSTCPVFDTNDPVCGTKCPPGAPVDWKGCPKVVVAPPPGTGPAVPPPPPPPKPIVARVLKVSINDGGLDVVVGGGSEQGVATGWKVTVLRGESGAPLSGGTGTVVRVNKTTTTIHVKLTSDQMNANSNVQLSP